MSEPAFESIGACVFDAYGTLFDVHSAVARLVASDSSAAFGGRSASVSDLWRQKQLEYTWLRSLMAAHADFWTVTADALDYALAAHEISDDGLKTRLMDLYLTLEAYHDVGDCLSRLRSAGLKTALLSNGSPRMLESAVTAAGLGEALDACLSVEEVGVFKPDSRVYRLAVDRLAVAAGQVCFVSTNAWDASGAANFGFNVAWLNRFGKQPERLPGRIRAEMAGLAELPTLLGV